MPLAAISARAPRTRLLPRRLLLRRQHQKIGHPCLMRRTPGGTRLAVMQVSETRRLILDAAVDASVMRGTLIIPADDKRDLHGWLEVNTPPLEAILGTSARCPSSDAACIGAEVRAKSSASSAAAPAANAITNSGGAPADNRSATMTSSGMQAVTGGSGAIGDTAGARSGGGSLVAGWHRTRPRRRSFIKCRRRRPTDPFGYGC